MYRLFAILCLGAVACATPEPQAADPCGGVTCRPGARCVEGSCVSQGGSPDAGDTDRRDTAGDIGPADTLTDLPAPDAGDDVAQDAADAPDEVDANADAPVDLPEDVQDVAEDLGEDTPDAVPDVRDVPPDEPEACAVAAAEATPATLPVDIIWFVDTSGSMDQETDLVEEKINDFAAFISRSGIDHHVIMVGSNSSVCVPAPLSSGGCPDRDSDRYFHVRQSVGSNDGLELVSTHYPAYSHFLREGAQVHIVAVTDDESDWSASRFTVSMRDRRNPGFPNGFTFHSVVAYGDVPFFGCIGWSGAGAGIGQQYLTLSRQTGGVTAPICEEDWDPIFRAIADNVVEGSLLPCNFTIPDPGEFLEVDPARVNVRFTPGMGEDVILPNYDAADDCEGAGWYYDDPENPTEVILCPDSCGFVEGSIDIEFGCDIVKG